MKDWDWGIIAGIGIWACIIGALMIIIYTSTMMMAGAHG